MAGVWTAAGAGYLEEMRRRLFGRDYPLAFAYSVSRCKWIPDPHYSSIFWDPDAGYFRKDLAKVKKRGFRLERTVAVDDKPYIYPRQYGNVIGVRPYKREVNDNELSLLLPYLEWLSEQPNVRRIEKRGWWMQVQQQNLATNEVTS